MGDQCDKTIRQLSGYIDRELSDSEVRTVRHHLEDCPPCEKLFEFQAGMKRLVRRECCTDEAPARLRDWVRKLATGNPASAE